VAGLHPDSQGITAFTKPTAGLEKEKKKRKEAEERRIKRGS